MNSSSENMMNQKSKRLRRYQRRSGISLFEVLISILVASIGLFGILVMIPFAVKSAELGIDHESAIAAAKNFNADFQAYGYNNAVGWYDNDFDPTTVVAPDDPVQTNWASPAAASPNQLQPTMADIDANGNINGDTNIVAGFPYIIDPVGAAAADDTTPVTPYGRFPVDTAFSSGGEFLPRINRINLRDSAKAIGVPLGMDMELARRIGLQNDDLVFESPDEETGPPRQAYFSVDSIQGVKRQHRGQYSTISFVIPEDDLGRQYRMYTIVGKAGDRTSERVFALTNFIPAGGGPNRGYQGMLLGGGDLLLTEATATIPAEKPQIRNNDWILLVNYYRAALPTDPIDGDPLYDDIQMNFYRVIHASGPDAMGGHGVTVQGPDFDIFRDWDPAPLGGPGSQTTETLTYAILIPNVLAVYERTFRAESDSVWNTAGY